MVIQNVAVDVLLGLYLFGSNYGSSVKAANRPMAAGPELATGNR